MTVATCNHYVLVPIFKFLTTVNHWFSDAIMVAGCHGETTTGTIQLEKEERKEGEEIWEKGSKEREEEINSMLIRRCVHIRTFNVSAFCVYVVKM